MLRRRFAFATPFVLVACRPAPPADPTEHDDSEHEWQAAATPPPPVDAAVDADAEPPAEPPADAPVDAPVDVRPVATADPCDPRELSAVRCSVNPPPPGWGKSTGNPPAPFRGRVLKREVQGDGLVLTFSVPEDWNVKPGDDWTTEVVDDQGRPVANGKVSLVQCRRATCTGTTKLSADQIAWSPYVRTTRRY